MRECKNNLFKCVMNGAEDICYLSNNEKCKEVDDGKGYCSYLNFCVVCINKSNCEFKDLS